MKYLLKSLSIALLTIFMLSQSPLDAFPTDKKEKKEDKVAVKKDKKEDKATPKKEKKEEKASAKKEKKEVKVETKKEKKEEKTSPKAEKKEVKKEPKGSSKTYKEDSVAPQCKGTTKEGDRCLRKTTDPSGYCWQHKK